jgi:uncharacterized phiE125 gp8 family phage protein
MPILYSKVTAQPDVEPIVLADAKVHLRVDGTDEDTLIDILITAAREMVEKRTNRSLITQTRTVKMDYFPISDTILLPHGPVQSVTHVKYYDEDEVLQTFADTLYWVDVDSDIARIVVKDDGWPETEDMPNAVEIEYEAGYGDAGSDVPKPLIQAMYLILGHLYENREQVGDIRHELPFGAEILMSNYILEQNVHY